MSDKKSLLVSIGLGLAILSLGEVASAQVNQSTLTTGISATSSVSNAVTNVDFGSLTVNGVQSQDGGISIGPVPFREAVLPIPQDVFQSISTNSNVDNSLGNVNETVTTVNADGLENSPGPIIICLTDSCSPGDNSITITDLASLIEQDLNQAFDNLVIAEQAASEGLVASDDSRRIIRRQSETAQHCDCIPGEITISREPSSATEYAVGTGSKTVAEARQIVETKLEESSAFVEKVNQLKPENSLW